MKVQRIVNHAARGYWFIRPTITESYDVPIKAVTADVVLESENWYGIILNNETIYTPKSEWKEVPL